MDYHSLNDIFADQLAEIWSAERQLVVALPKLADAAASDKLRAAVDEHLAETHGHVARLERIIDRIDRQVPPVHCEAMDGLLRDGARVLSSGGDPRVRDVALIATAQRIEHYEIAAYGTVRAIADELGWGEISDMLVLTLNEENRADQTLSRLATGGFLREGLNERAAR